MVDWSSDTVGTPSAMRLVSQLQPLPPRGEARRSFAAALRVAGDHPVSRGHYPGRPIVPGSLLVEAAWHALQAIDADVGLRLQRVDALQLVSAVQPGDALQLQLHEHATQGAGPSRWHASVWCQGRQAARFQLTAGAAACEPASTDAPQTPTDTWQPLDAPDIARRLPHRAPLLLVDGASRHPGGDRLIAWHHVTLAELCFAGVPLQAHAETLHYPAPLLLESFAQAAGLLLCGERWPAANTDLMLLGGVRELLLLGQARPGDLLQHELTLSRRFADAALVSGTVFAGRRPVARVRDLLIALKRSTASASSFSTSSGAHSHATS